ncbi:hypothetical protein [Streptomyces sp. NBC_01789]|uniref:hypothetical protein n=1 Tax=Streptomyces sp. NBC_01789 TaxID=2975941 RepID=UPI0022506254|nr:hypothetical protein [Streptomyces sp. NBC_01789]MCX4444919.1 hypothetical protein [Streptomyces sp. NBC_01789]
MRGLLERGILTGHDGIHRPGEAVRGRPASHGHDAQYRLTHAGHMALAGLGIDTDRLPPRRPAGQRSATASTGADTSTTSRAASAPY